MHKLSLSRICQITLWYWWSLNMSGRKCWYYHNEMRFLSYEVERVEREYTGFTSSVRLSASLSVRLWTKSCPLCISHNTIRVHFIFAYLIKQLQKGCREWSLFQNLNFWRIFGICNFDFVLLWHGIWYKSTVWVIGGGGGGGFSERRRSCCSSLYLWTSLLDIKSVWRHLTLERHLILLDCKIPVIFLYTWRWYTMYAVKRLLTKVLLTITHVSICIHLLNTFAAKSTYFDFLQSQQNCIFDRCLNRMTIRISDQ